MNSRPTVVENAESDQRSQKKVVDVLAEMDIPAQRRLGLWICQLIHEMDKQDRIAAKYTCEDSLSLPTGMTLDAVNHAYAMEEYERNGRNKSALARTLDLNIKTVHNKFKRWKKRYG